VGILVLGMHRSGTSVTTALLGALAAGVALPPDDFPACEDNPGGYFESRALTVFNDRILDLLGGSASRSPDRSPGWSEFVLGTPGFSKEEALKTFRTVFPHGRWLWKDPRVCLLGDYWLHVLDDLEGVVLPFRNPLEVARSLEQRESWPGRTNLDQLYSLWQEHVLDALRTAEGRPTSVSSYASLLDETDRWIEQAEGFLDLVGVPRRAKAKRAVVSIVERDWYRSRADPSGDGDDAAVTDPVTAAVYRQLLELEGVHPALEPMSMSSRLAG